MTYTFTVEIPDWPAEAWVGAGVGAWYLFAYAIIRLLPYSTIEAWGLVPRHMPDNHKPWVRAIAWLFSPLAFSSAAASGIGTMLVHIAFGKGESSPKEKTS